MFAVVSPMLGYRAGLVYSPTNWGLEVEINVAAGTVRGSYVDNPTTAAFDATLSRTFANDVWYAIAVRLSGNTVSVFYDGSTASTTGGNGGIRADAYGMGQQEYGGATYYQRTALAGITGKALSNDNIFEILRDPYRVLTSVAPSVYFLPSAGGGGAITGTGSPAAQSATVSGTATRTVTGSGTPAAQAATVSGTAEREITSSGTPAAQSATVSGTGTVGAVVTGSGAPQAQSATVAGTAEREVTASGTVAAQSATVSGTAEREITSSGTPTAQSATVVGTGQVGNIISGSGTPTAQSATVSGTAEREITASGAVAASSATVAGTAERTITGTGTLSASSATVYGFDSAPADTGVRRIYPAGGARIDREIDGWLKNQEEKSRLALIAREDEEILMVMLALAA